MSFATATATATAAPLFPVASLDRIDDGVSAVRGEIELQLRMRHAGQQGLRLRYELIGAADAPVVLVAGGISAHRHLAGNAGYAEKGWAEGLVGAGRALDPACRRLLGF
ncbi:MAG: homoserine O-succinyltransferase, partial [Stenotrophomonas sp.]